MTTWEIHDMYFSNEVSDISNIGISAFQSHLESRSSKVLPHN